MHITTTDPSVNKIFHIHCPRKGIDDYILAQNIDIATNYYKNYKGEKDLIGCLVTEIPEKEFDKKGKNIIEI